MLARLAFPPRVGLWIFGALGDQEMVLSPVSIAA